MLNKESFQELYTEIATEFLQTHDDVQCSRTVNYYTGRKIMHFVISVDDICRFNLVVEMKHNDDVIEWAFDKDMNISDCVYYESKLTAPVLDSWFDNPMDKLNGLLNLRVN